MPSAFSSPATHFKPIVIQDNESKSSESIQHSQTEMLSQSKLKDTDVVAKLREIKQNIVKNKTVGSVERENNDSDLNNDKSNLKSTDDVGATLKQLDSQGQLPSTEVLATAIAQYLRTHISGATSDCQTKTSQTINNSNVPTISNNTEGSSSDHRIQTTPAHNLQTTPAHNMQTTPHSFQSPSNTHTPYSGSLYISQVPGSNTVLTNATSVNIMSLQHSSPIMPQTRLLSNGPPTTNPNFLQEIIPHSPAPPQRTMQHQLPVPYPLPTSTMSAMPAAFSNHPAGNVPVQFTLVQDPVTGIMQMVPVSYLPLSQSPATYNSTQNDQNFAVNKNIPSNQTPEHKSFSQSTSSERAGSMVNSVNNQHKQFRDGKSNNTPSDKSIKQVKQTNGFDSVSSSPSPSKDSGICLTQQASVKSINNESLMDRLLSSENSQRQEVLSRVVRKLRDEFAEDGVFDSGVEDLAIGKLLSLFLKICVSYLHIIVFFFYYFLLIF